jgi:hypothetical protein
LEVRSCSPDPFRKSLTMFAPFTRRHWYSTFAVFMTTLTSWSLPSDMLRIRLCWYLTEGLALQTRSVIRIVVVLWVVLLCRLPKYIGHFTRYPTDLKWLLLIPIVGYVHSCIIKPYALFTLKVVSVQDRTHFTKCQVTKHVQFFLDNMG